MGKSHKVTRCTQSATLTHISEHSLPQATDRTRQSQAEAAASLLNLAAVRFISYQLFRLEEEGCVSSYL